MKTILATLFAILALLATGCASPETIQRRSSLTAYLGGKEAPQVAESHGSAKLQLPLRLGIAFVPNDSTVRKSQAGGLGTGPDGLFQPDQEQALQQKVAELFQAKPWTQTFKIIPSHYLTRDGGFGDLDLVTRTFGVDVIALVSMDQIQFSTPRWYAWTYWTLVGAYMIKGDKNDTTTVVDAAVYHVPSRTFLFRASGVGTIKGSSSWSGREDAFRKQSRESLSLAMDNLSPSLDQGVTLFKQDILKGARRDVLLLDKEGNPLGSTAYDPARH
jgi:rhombotail lipoprotein